MEKRYEGFLAPHGLYVLDTQTGDVRFILHGSNIPTSTIESFSDSKSISLESYPKTSNNFSSFENEVIASYPYLIAKPFSDLLKETDSRMKCKLMVDTFTAVLKYLALQLASEYIRAKDLKDIQIHQTLTKVSRPLISAWNLLIARCLPVMTDNKIPLFSPEIKSAYEKLESKCKDPFLVTQTYSDENGELKTKTKKLGKIQALINYRNGLAHGFNQSQARAQKEFDEYYPLLCDILQEIRFVSRYTLWHVESNKEGINGIRLMGASPSSKKVDFERSGINPSISPLFIINDATGDLLPLYAFFDVDQSCETGLPELGKDVFVFEGNTKNSVIYLSSSGEHLEKTTRFNHWKDLLAQKQLEVSWIDEKKLTLEIFHSIGSFISSSGIQALIASGKYLKEATIPRKDLDELLDSFIYSAYNGFVLGGESGIGKSTLLAKKTEEWQMNGNMVCFYRGSALNQTDIANKFLRDCALKINYLEDFLSIANPIFKTSGKYCYLIIDALNEYSGDLNNLIKSIDSIVAQASGYKWFKVIVSIRESAYNRSQEKFGQIATQQFYTVEEDKGGEKIMTNVIRLQPLSKDFLELLYNAYREFKWKDTDNLDAEGIYKFRPLTEFKDFKSEGSTIELLRNPLMARLIMQSFHRSKLPDELNNDEAMRLYLDNIIIEKSDDYQGFPERKKLLILFVIELDRNNTERLDRDYLLNIPSIRSYLINNQKDSPYIQLLDLGALMEEWEKDTCFVRFSFDKFFEFLLAELHWPKIHDVAGLFELCKRASNYKILQGAIEIIIIRFCQNEQYNFLVDIIDMAENSNDEMKRVIKEICIDILYDLAIQQINVFKKTIDLIPQKPSHFDLEILNQLINKLYLRGHLKEFEFALDTAITEASILEDRKTMSSLLLKKASYANLQGRTDEFNTIIESALTLSKDSGNDKIYSQCIITKAAYQRVRGFLDESEKLLLDALKINQNIEDQEGIIDTLSELGILYLKQSKIQEAENLFLQSLEIARSIGHQLAIGDSLRYLGRIYKDQNNIEKSKELYFESVEISRSLGDKKGVSNTLNAIGIIYYALGNYSEAINYFLESLDIYKQLSNKSGMKSITANLGVVYYETGKDVLAKEYLLKSINLESELNITNIASIHRVYHLLDSTERQLYKDIIDKKNAPSITKKDRCWIASIELMNLCLVDENLSATEIISKIDEVSQFKEESKLFDIDDLPVESFVIAVKKLQQINEPLKAISIAKKTLTWIGERKTRQKYELERISNSTAYNSV